MYFSLVVGSITYSVGKLARVVSVGVLVAGRQSAGRVAGYLRGCPGCCSWRQSWVVAQLAKVCQPISG